MSTERRDLEVSAHGALPVVEPGRNAVPAGVRPPSSAANCGPGAGINQVREHSTLSAQARPQA
jgi:hypothetical protein